MPVPLFDLLFDIFNPCALALEAFVILIFFLLLPTPPLLLGVLDSLDAALMTLAGNKVGGKLLA